MKMIDQTVTSTFEAFMADKTVTLTDDGSYVVATLEGVYRVVGGYGECSEFDFTGCSAMGHGNPKDDALAALRHGMSGQVYYLRSEDKHFLGIKMFHSPGPQHRFPRFVA
jgi:hypothetical protein